MMVYYLFIVQVYFYDTKARVQDEGSDKKKKSDEPNYFASLKKMENKQDVSVLCVPFIHILLNSFFF